MSNLRDFAAEHRRIMRRKADLLPKAANREECWNILLDLADSYLAGRRISITDACYGSGAPTTTALRHIGVLVEHRLAVRQPDPNDQRRDHLKITSKGFDLVESIISDPSLIGTERRASCLARERQPGLGEPPHPDRASAAFVFHARDHAPASPDCAKGMCAGFSPEAV